MDKELLCPACGNLYKDPYTLLTCQHDLCLGCIKNLVFHRSICGDQESGLVKFECPNLQCEEVMKLWVNISEQDLEIDVNLSPGIKPNLLLGKMSNALAQIEEKQQRESIDKDKKIHELEEQLCTGGFPMCMKHVTQGMEKSLYCAQCEMNVCPLCVVKRHSKHAVFSASLKDAYNENKPRLVESIKSAETCVELIHVELKAHREAIKPAEQKNSELMARLKKYRDETSKTIAKVQNVSHEAEVALTEAMTAVKEPLLEYNSLLEALVKEISAAQKKLQSGAVNEFEKSRNKLAALQTKRVKEVDAHNGGDFQKAEIMLNTLQKLSRDLSVCVYESVVWMRGEEDSPSCRREAASNDFLGTTSMEVNRSNTSASSSKSPARSPEIPFVDSRDVNDGLLCGEEEKDKRAYITALDLRPREVPRPTTETVDKGVQCKGSFEVELLVDCGIQVEIEYPEQDHHKLTNRKRRAEPTGNEPPAKVPAEAESRTPSACVTFDGSGDSRVRLSEAASEAPTMYHTPDQSASDFGDQPSTSLVQQQDDDTLVEESGQEKEAQVDLPDADTDTTIDVSESFIYRRLSFEEDDIRPGRFILVAHFNDAKEPWIGKIMSIGKKYVQVIWYSGKLAAKSMWTVYNNQRDKVDREAIHTTFTFDESGVMPSALVRDLRHFMGTLAEGEESLTEAE